MGKFSGKCLCGSVAFSFALDKPGVTACHCGQCRAWSGHYWASVNVPFDSFSVDKGESEIAWYRSSDYAERGFCRNCGASIFWRADRLEDHKNRIAVAAGTITTPAALAIDRHIFVADKGGYYAIGDGAPQIDRY